MAGMQTASGDYIDSSWELRVLVGEEDPEAEAVTLRVTGESHVGGVLLKIVEQISECPPPQGLRHRVISRLQDTSSTSPASPWLHRSGVCPRAWSIVTPRAPGGGLRLRGTQAPEALGGLAQPGCRGPAPTGSYTAACGICQRERPGQGREGWHRRPGRVAGSR